MPLTDPTAARDKSEEWIAEFRKNRIAALRPLVTADLVALHRENPRGPHPHELNLILNFVRGPAFPMDNKPFVHMRHAYDEYGIAYMTPRGELVGTDSGPVYASESEAIHACFLQRLEAHGLSITSEQGEANV